MESTQTPYSILFLCSQGDTEQIEACQATEAETVVVPWEAGRSDYPRKMNYGYNLTAGEYMLLGSDDITFHDEWDVRVLEVAEATGAGVIGTNDMANRHVMKGQFSTHALVRRSYVEEMGASLDGPNILISESYDHNYCDRELCALAQARKTWAFAPESRIQHRHPLWRTTEDDSTYQKGRKSANHDHETFFMRCVNWNQVGILPQEKKWLDQHIRYQRRIERRRRLGLK